jgi:Cys-rich protein (TIGR04453 family)
MNLSKLYFQIFFLSLAFWIIQCDEYVENKCNQACTKFTQCAEERYGSQKQFSDVDRSKLRIDCERGCTREQSFILPCFETETSCKGLQACVLESGYMD